MAQEHQRIDITNTPEVLKLAEEVQRTKEPYLLQRGSEDIAVLLPAPQKKSARSRVKPVTEDDALFRLIGIGRSDIEGGISEKKHEYLLRAKRSHG